MTNYRRYSGRCFSFTVVTYKRRGIFVDEFARKLLREAWGNVLEKRPFEVLAFCLMEDHFHCVWRLPSEDCDYSLRMSLIKKGFSRRYIANGGSEIPQSRSRVRKRERGIWQRRFWEHSIKSEDDLQNHINYIHYNPVKHGLVDSPGDWPWSTYQKYRNRYGDVDWNAVSKLVLPGNFEYEIDNN